MPCALVSLDNGHRCPYSQGEDRELCKPQKGVEGQLPCSSTSPGLWPGHQRPLRQQRQRLAIRHQPQVSNLSSCPAAVPSPTGRGTVLASTATVSPSPSGRWQPSPWANGERAPAWPSVERWNWPRLSSEPAQRRPAGALVPGRAFYTLPRVPQSRFHVHGLGTDTGQRPTAPQQHRPSPGGLLSSCTGWGQPSGQRLPVLLGQAHGTTCSFPRHACTHAQRTAGSCRAFRLPASALQACSWPQDHGGPGVCPPLSAHRPGEGAGRARSAPHPQL